MEPKEQDTPAGVGPGITGASGDLIDSTGHGKGIGGTGHDDERDAAGLRPQDNYTARPDEQGSGEDPAARTTRPSGSSSGTVGGGGNGALADVPGGGRNVSPANDRASEPDHVHEGQGHGSDRTTYIRAGNPGTDDEH